MEIEQQKQKQLELLEQIEQQKLRLETDCFRAQLEEQRKKADQLEVGWHWEARKYFLCPTRPDIFPLRLCAVPV